MSSENAAAKAIGRWAIAHAVIRVEEYLFDYLFYPFMLYAGGAGVLQMLGISGDAAAGYWTGFAILVVLTALLNVLYLLLYDRTRRDWFGFEYLRQMKPPRAMRRVSFLAQPMRLAMFCYLSVWQNPLFATLWLRSRDREFSMGRRDWVILAVAIVAANLGWTALVTVAGTVVQAIWAGS